MATITRSYKGGMGYGLDINMISDLSGLDPKKHLIAIMRTVNSIAKKCRTVIKREISSQYNIKIKDIYIKVRQASSGESSAWLSGSPKPIPLIKFATTDNAPQGPAVVRVIRGGMQVIPHAFINSVYQSWPSVYARAGTKRHPLLSVKLSKEYSLTIQNVLFGTQMQSRIQAYIKANAQKQYESELQYALTGKRTFTDLSGYDE